MTTNVSTKNNSEPGMKDKLREATNFVVYTLGGVALASDAIGVSRSTVSRWVSNGMIPPRAAYSISNTKAFSDMGFTLERIRPDIDVSAITGVKVDPLQHDVITRQRSHANEEQAAQMKVAAQSLIDALGGLTHTSKVLDVKYYVLNSWRTRGRIPAYQAERISKIPQLADAGFTFEFMRPDLTKRIEI